MSKSELADLKPMYLIHGSEDLLLDQAVDRLKKRLASFADLDFNLDQFDGESAEASDIVAAANTLPFMSERRLVIVRRADKMSTEALGALADYAANPNPETTLVLVAAKLARNLRIYKAIDGLGGVAEYRPPAKRDYPKTVVEMFATRGKRIGLDAAEVLVRAIGHDLRRISIEMEKVIAFTGDEATLSRHAIEQVISTTAPTSVFEFLDSLGSRDARGSLRLLASLMSEGESIHGIHALSVRHIRNLLSMSALESREVAGSLSGMAREIGVLDWQARNLRKQSSRFASGELRDALRAAAESEKQMKTSQNARLVFERWIVGVCGEA